MTLCRMAYQINIHIHISHSYCTCMMILYVWYLSAHPHHPPSCTICNPRFHPFHPWNIGRFTALGTLLVCIICGCCIDRIRILLHRTRQALPELPETWSLGNRRDGRYINMYIHVYIIYIYMCIYIYLHMYI